MEKEEGAAGWRHRRWRQRLWREWEELWAAEEPVRDRLAAALQKKVSGSIVRRLALGMTRKEFAQYMGVSPNMVSKWESAGYNFSIRALADIAAKLGWELRLELGGEPKARTVWRRTGDRRIRRPREHRPCRRKLALRLTGRPAFSADR